MLKADFCDLFQRVGAVRYYDVNCVLFVSVVKKAYITFRKKYFIFIGWYQALISVLFFFFGIYNPFTDLPFTMFA